MIFQKKVRNSPRAVLTGTALLRLINKVGLVDVGRDQHDSERYRTAAVYCTTDGITYQLCILSTHGELIGIE